MSVNGLDVLSINICPREVHILHEFSVTVPKRLSVNVHPRDVIESVDIRSESGIPGMNGLGPESSLNVLNGLNGLGTESAQEHTLS